MQLSRLTLRLLAQRWDSPMTTAYDFSAKILAGEDQSLSAYKGKVLLIVNTASECGFTPQYEGLEALQRKYAERGFSVLGFPCNQFGAQEPGDSRAIADFCQTNYGVTFPMFAKIEVNGENAHPLYKFLKQEKSGLLGSEAIKWNFTKFLIGRDGQVAARYAPSKTPASLEKPIEALL
jgi:glutathione peroxidase